MFTCPRCGEEVDEAMFFCSEHSELMPTRHDFEHVKREAKRNHESEINRKLDDKK